jgi:hypothetical protein
MNTRRDPDRLIHDFLMEGATELADPVYDAVRADIESNRQRVVIGPWRMPTLNKLVPIGLGAVAVVVALVLGTQLLGPPRAGGVGGAPSAKPSATAAPSAAQPSPSPSESAPALTGTFTSERHGISISYPIGWVTRPATEPWTTMVPDYLSNAGDVFYDPVREGNLWIAFASQPIGDSAPAAWAADTIAIDDGCGTTEPLAVDGATGLIGAGECTRATLTTAGRGYFFWLYTGGDEPLLATIYDRAWFEEVLATVQLQSEAAVDGAPSASP